MDELAEFLLARIAEDESAALVATGREWVSVVDTPHDDDHCGDIYADGDWNNWVASWDRGPANGEHIARHDPARALAECEAKRRIVKRHLETAPPYYNADQQTEHEQGTLYVILPLAAIYADHPDYNPDWRP